MSEIMVADKPVKGKRRARRGTGSVFERGGVWYAVFKFKGTRYRWSSGSPLKSDATAILDWAADSELIDRAPIPKRLVPVIPEGEPRVLTTDEQRRVVGIEDPFGFACRLMLGCGARWSEMVRLRAEDLADGELILRPGE